VLARQKGRSPRLSLHDVRATVSCAALSVRAQLRGRGFLLGLFRHHRFGCDEYVPRYQWFESISQR